MAEKTDRCKAGEREKETIGGRKKSDYVGVKKAHLLGFGSGVARELAGQASARWPVSKARRDESEALRCGGGAAGPMEGRALAFLPFAPCSDEGARDGVRLEQHVGCRLSCL